MLLNLHQVRGQADWAAVSPDRRNSWQRVAAATNGIVTIGNFFSLLSFVLTLFGLLCILRCQQYIAGSTVIFIGRVCDMLDGYLADKTATKSRLGEAVDAASDKVITLSLLILLAVYSVVPAWYVVLLGAPQIIIALIVIIALRRRRQLHPEYLGKLSMGAGWVGLLLYIVAHAESGSRYDVLQTAGIVLLALSVFLGTMAVFKHYRTLSKA